MMTKEKCERCKEIVSQKTAMKNTSALRKETGKYAESYKEWFDEQESKQLRHYAKLLATRCDCGQRATILPV